jgi:hypothetical protein
MSAQSSMLGDPADQLLMVSGRAALEFVSKRLDRQRRSVRAR